MKELPDLVPEALRAISGSTLVRGESEMLPFRLENGRAALEPYFATVELRLYDDSLYITEVEPLLAYAFSMLQPGMEVPETAVTQLRQLWAAKIAADGGIHISKHSGVFEAYK